MMKFKASLEKMILIAVFFLIATLKGVSAAEYFGFMKEFILFITVALIVYFVLFSKNQLILDELKSLKLKKDEINKSEEEEKKEEESKASKTFSFKISLNYIYIFVLGPLYIFNFVVLSSVATTLLVIEIIMFILTISSQIVFLNNSNRILKEGGEK